MRELFLTRLIKDLLNYKRPNFWIIVIAVIIVAAAAVGLLTNPVGSGVIMVNNIIYRQSHERLNDLPSDAYEIGKLESILHNRDEAPEHNFQGAMLDEKYSGNLLYQGETGNKIYLEDLSGCFIEFISDETPVSADKRFYIMTADDGAPIGCEYGTTHEVGDIDTIVMLSMLEELQGFEFYEEDASHQYIEFQFLREKPKEIYLRYITEGEWQTEYPIDSVSYKIKVPVKAGKYSFFADITWKNQEKEIVFFDITVKADESSNHDKISTYLKEECINVFSPYYELLDFIISDYHEEVVNGNVEAVFNYKMIDKNYDKDPDTVEYIKEAKERGDKNYKQLYDEYLQPKESNFYFKAVIDENGEITLYSKNPAIDNDEWNEVKMEDYIIK